MVDVKLLDIEWIIINYDCICIVSKLFMGIKVCVKKDLNGKVKFYNIWIKMIFFWDMYLKYLFWIVIIGCFCKEFNFLKLKSNDIWKIM